MQKIKERGANAVPPKKHASAYIIFGKEKRAEILLRSPQAKVTQVVKEIAACWGRMNKEDRHKYNVLAKRGKFKFEFSCLDKERYDKELKGLVKFSKSLYKPKKCLSAYMIFVKEVSYIFSFTLQTRPKIVQANPDMGALIVMKYVGKAWKNLTKQER